MKQEKIAQWVLPVATGGLLVLNALHGEQQRTTEVVSGTFKKLNPFSS